MLLIVRDARELASLRTPRMQKEAIDEYCDWVSREVTMGNFVVDPKTGEWIHSSGQILDEHREAWLKSRPHALVPAVLEDPVDDTWTANPASLTKRGARLKQLREFCGSDAAALVLLKEEAARFGVKNPLSTEVGGVAVRVDKKAASASNPWNDAHAQRNGLAASHAERDRLMKTLGLKKCAALAAAAGVSITGVKL